MHTYILGIHIQYISLYIHKISCIHTSLEYIYNVFLYIYIKYHAYIHPWNTYTMYLFRYTCNIMHTYILGIHIQCICLYISQIFNRFNYVSNLAPYMIWLKLIILIVRIKRSRMIVPTKCYLMVLLNFYLTINTYF